MKRNLLLLARKTFFRDKITILIVLILMLMMSANVLKINGTYCGDTYFPASFLGYMITAMLISTDARTNYAFTFVNTNLTGILPVSRKEFIIFKYISNFIIVTMLFILTFIINTCIKDMNNSLSSMFLIYFVTIIIIQTLLFTGNFAKKDNVALFIIYAVLVPVLMFMVSIANVIALKIVLPIYAIIVLLVVPVMYSLLLIKIQCKKAEKCNFEDI